MAELTDVLTDEFIPRQSGIHDVHDTGTLRSLSTTLTKYTNDGATRNEGSITLWDTANNIVDCTGLPVWSKIDINVSTTVASGNQGAVILMEFRCPNNGSPFTLTQVAISIERSLEYPINIGWSGYVGPEVELYGIELYAGLVSGSLDTTNQKILVRA